MVQVSESYVKPCSSRYISGGYRGGGWCGHKLQGAQRGIPVESRSVPGQNATCDKYNGRKRVLATGGAGFLGSHLIDRLLLRGDEVLCADNLFNGTKRNIEHLLSHPRFEFMRHDITFPLFVEVDEIYNLACPASPIHCQHDPVQTTKTSVHGAINMLGLAKRLRCRIFQASTSEVYGDPCVHPQVESYWGNVNPIGIRSCYDEGKRCAETLFFDVPVRDYRWTRAGLLAG